MTEYWRAIESRDRTMDGVFVYGVATTRIFCRPSCASRQPLPQNVSFFARATEAEAAGYRPCKRCRPEAPQHPATALMEAACRYIEEHAGDSFTLASLARHIGYSPFHLQRTFKAALGVTPRAYAESVRVAAAKQNLRNGARVSEPAFHLGMTPTAYRKGGKGLRITFTVADSPLGRMLVAETGLGVCSITFGDSDEALEQALRTEFNAATITRADSSHTEAVLRHLTGANRILDLPLDIQAAAFQRIVWEQLQKIPYGETRSYAEVASEIGRPTANRAVARACATNPVALVIPCHRVVRETGALSGYRWGIARKQTLLDKERQ